MSELSQLRRDIPAMRQRIETRRHHKSPERIRAMEEEVARKELRLQELEAGLREHSGPTAMEPPVNLVPSGHPGPDSVTLVDADVLPGDSRMELAAE